MGHIFIAMNGKRINSLDDLRNNFNPSQILAFYKAKRLQAWLEELGCQDELESINSFETDYDDDILLSMLMAVFDLNDEQIAKSMPKQDKLSNSTENCAITNNTDNKRSAEQVSD